MMMEGKVRTALKLLSDNSDTGLLSLGEIIDDISGKTVRDVLEDKHPVPQPAHPEAILRDTDNDSLLSLTASQGNPSGLLLFTLREQPDPLDLMHSTGDDFALPLGKSRMICVRP